MFSANYVSNGWRQSVSLKRVFLATVSGLWSLVSPTLFGAALFRTGGRGQPARNTSNSVVNVWQLNKNTHRQNLIRECLLVWNVISASLKSIFCYVFVVCFQKSSLRVSQNALRGWAGSPSHHLSIWWRLTLLPDSRSQKKNTQINTHAHKSCNYSPYARSNASSHCCGGCSI